jgi:hypothetical protein
MPFHPSTIVLPDTSTHNLVDSICQAHCQLQAVDPNLFERFLKQQESTHPIAIQVLALPQVEKLSCLP